MAPCNVEILNEGNGEPTGVFLDRSCAPVVEYTLFRCVPRITKSIHVVIEDLGLAHVGPVSGRLGVSSHRHRR